MLEGSCLCGAVRYEVDAAPGPIIHCHCRTCRKAHGAAFSSLMPVPRTAFRWLAGEDKLSAFESSVGKRRRFCRDCGSQIVAERDTAPVIMLRLGCLDTEIEGNAKAHIWRSDCASWYDPKVILQEFPQGFPSK